VTLCLGPPSLQCIQCAVAISDRSSSDYLNFCLSGTQEGDRVVVSVPPGGGSLVFQRVAPSGELPPEPQSSEFRAQEESSVLEKETSSVQSNGSSTRASEGQYWPYSHSKLSGCQQSGCGLSLRLFSSFFSVPPQVNPRKMKQA
jgi:hypothetical protein